MTCASLGPPDRLNSELRTSDRRREAFVSDTVLAVLVMLVSSAMYALSFVLQYRGTQQSIGLDQAPGPGRGEAGRSGVARLARNPAWLFGVVLFGLSFLVHLVALSLGAVAVVQPLLVTELIFIPPFAALINHTRIGGRDWLAIAVVCIGLAGFLTVAAPSQGSETPSATEWAILLTTFLAAMAVLMLFGRGRGDTARATLFGVAAGLANALLALTAKGAFGGQHPSIGAWLSDPLVWLTVLVAWLTVGTTALAFRSGPITASTPAMIAVNPVVSSVAAMWLFGETIRATPVALALSGACAVIVIIGVYVLSNSAAVHPAEPVARAPAPGSPKT
jgi:drug/metabolite transporter (DMT)-like permease